MSAAAMPAKLARAVAATAALCVAASHVLALGGAWQGAAPALAAAGAGWGVLIAAAWLADGSCRTKTIDALTTTLSVGVTVLLPALVAAFVLTADAAGVAPTLGVAASFLTVLWNWRAAVLARSWVSGRVAALRLGAGAVLLGLVLVSS